MAYFTKHFHERLFERRGVVLDNATQKAIINLIHKDLAQNPVPRGSQVQYDCKVNNDKFTLVLDTSNMAILTAVLNARTGRKKMKQKVYKQMHP